MRRGGEGVARVVLDLAGDDGEHRIEVGLPARRGQAPARRRQPCRQPGGRGGAPAGERLPARAARAREGRARGAAGPSRPGGGRAVAEPRRDAQRLLARAGAAERAARADPRRRRRARRRSTPGTPSWPRHGHPADGRPGRGRGRAAAAVRRPRASSSGSRARRSCATGRARTRATPKGSPRSSPSAARPTSTAASPRTGPHRDELQLLLGGVRCAPTARRASSAPPCWRSCSPSATLLAERRARPPLMLLDDVMSELDAERRELLADLLRPEARR